MRIVNAESDVAEFECTGTPGGTNVEVVGAWLHEPDPSIVKAGLIDDIAAVFGAWHSRRLAWRHPTLPVLARIFAGGLVMAFGSLMIPGGNDALLLIGAPSFHGYALTALATMAATIGGLQLLALRR